MNKYESFRRGLLEKAAFNASSNTAIYVSTWGLSAEFDIPESHVREQLLWLANEGYISLVVWDGARERPYNEWPDAESFFANKTEGGTLRIKLLSAGGEFLTSLPKRPITPETEKQSRKIFLVHGHAEEPKQNVATFLREIGLDVIILHEKANQGLTIIEKFEKHSGVGFAVVLLTPDDVGASALHPENTHRRARQNVILELGYFLAKLGRDKVCCLYVEGVEKPSDYDGVLYVPYDDDGAWRSKLATELTAAGIEFDSQKLSAPKNWDTVTHFSATLQGRKMTGRLKDLM